MGIFAVCPGLLVVYLDGHFEHKLKTNLKQELRPESGAGLAKIQAELRAQQQFSHGFDAIRGAAEEHVAEELANFRAQGISSFWNSYIARTHL